MLLTRILRRSALILGLMTLGLCAYLMFHVPAPAQARDGQVTLLHISRLMSQLLPTVERVGSGIVSFGGLSQAAEVIRKVKEKDPNAIFTLGGASLFGPLWRYFSGEPELTCLNIAGVQVGTIGTHELDFGWDHLKAALQFVHFPMLLSNVTITDPEVAQFFKKNIIIPYGDMKVGFFSMISPTMLNTTVPTKEMQVSSDLQGIALGMVKDLRAQGADVIIMISNLTEAENRDVAEDVAGIHAFLGRAITLNEQAKPIFVRGPDNWLTTMVWSGTGARFVGQLRLVLRDGRISEEGVDWTLLNVTDAAGTHPEISRIAKEFENRLDKQLDKVVGHFVIPVETRRKVVRNREVGIGNFVADALRWRLGTDIAVFTAGSIRGEKIYPTGSFSERTLREIFPFRNQFGVLRLKGAQVKQMFELSASALATEGDLYDASFRTPTGGFLQVSGVRVSYDLTKPPTTFNEAGAVNGWGSRLTGIELQRAGEWQALDDGAEYSVAMPLWIAEGGDRYFLFKDISVHDPGLDDMYLLMGYLDHKFPTGQVRLDTDGRIVIKR